MDANGEGVILHARTSDGWTLGLRRHRGDGPAVLLLHAMMVDHRSLYRGGLVDVLARAGLDVFVADFRGRGLSPVPDGRAPTWTYDDFVLRDLPALVAEVRRRTDAPLAIVGHSLGGHVAAAAIGCGAVSADALVGVAANVWSAELEPERLARLAKGATMRAFGALAGAVGRFPARRLRIGPVDEAADYVADLRRFWRTGRWTSRDGRLDWGAEQARVAIPVLAVIGTGDALYARPAGAAAWAARFPRHEIWRVGGGAHGIAGDPGHMDLVTDPTSAPVHEAIAGWITTTRGRVASR